MQRSKLLECKKCNKVFEYTDEQSYWQEAGTYSVKLVKCPDCNTINVIRYIDAPGLHVNEDSRYY